MRGVVKRHRLQVGDMFVTNSDLYTIIDGVLQRGEALSAPITAVYDAGQRCDLADGSTMVVNQTGVYIERPDAIPHVVPTDGPNAGKEIELGD